MSRTEHTKGRSSVVTVLLRVASVVLSPVVFGLSFLVPRDDTLWVFMAGNEGRRFADNAKYLFLHCDQTEVRCVWITSSPETRAALVAQGFDCRLATSVDGRRAMLRAGVFFETHGPVWPAYTGGARIVHLTHGNYLKTMLADHTRDWPSPLKAVVDLLFGRRRRHLVTGSGPPAAITRSMHEIPADRLLVTGFPRNDVLFGPIEGERIGANETALEMVQEQAERGPVLVYAPTWREAYGGKNGVPLSEIDMPLADLDGLLEDHDAHLYISPHPASSLEVADDLEHVSLLDSGGDLYPFLRHCDALVTDYSGIFYDFLLVDRPIVFYAPDLEQYLEDRELYFEYESHVPGPIATDDAAFVDAVRAVLSGEDVGAEQRRALREEFYEDADEGAAGRVYQAVRNWINGS